MILAVQSWTAGAAALTVCVGVPIALLLHHVLWDALLDVLASRADNNGLLRKFTMK